MAVDYGEALKQERRKLAPLLDKIRSPVLKVILFGKLEQVAHTRALISSSSREERVAIGEALSHKK